MDKIPKYINQHIEDSFKSLNEDEWVPYTSAYDLYKTACENTYKLMVNRENTHKGTKIRRLQKEIERLDGIIRDYREGKLAKGI